MPINPDAVGSKSDPTRRSWTSKDALLYAVGVGAGTDELAYTTENTKDTPQQVLPTFAVIVGTGGVPFDKIGSFNPAMLVHGEQSITLHQPLPVAATVLGTSRIGGIYDKEKAALVVLESHVVDKESGEPLFTNSSSLFIRGEGGWGGDRGPANKVEFPDRDADHVVTYETRTDQALLYRLNGDRNPLHSDPSFAAMGGFDKPILHGLCTYGFTGRALLHSVCGSDPDRFKAMSGRFSSPVMPGESLTISIWQDDGQAVFRTTVGDRTVFDNGVLQFS